MAPADSVHLRIRCFCYSLPSSKGLTSANWPRPHQNLFKTPAKSVSRASRGVLRVRGKGRIWFPTKHGEELKARNWDPHSPMVGVQDCRAPAARFAQGGGDTSSELPGAGRLEEENVLGVGEARGAYSGQGQDKKAVHGKCFHCLVNWEMPGNIRKPS